MAIFTVPGRDIIKVTDTDFINNTPNISSKVHIIRLSFDNPNDEKMEWVINKFYQTNRFIVDNYDIKYYNYYLKRTNLKYYVINTVNIESKLISFYKRNNKVLLDITILSQAERLFVLHSALQDILLNTEVIVISESDYLTVKDIIDKWRGNCIIYDPDYLI